MGFEDILAGFRGLLKRHGPITSEQRRKLHYVASEYMSQKGSPVMTSGACVRCGTPIKYGKPLSPPHLARGERWLEILRRDCDGLPWSNIKVRVDYNQTTLKIRRKTAQLR